MKTLFKYAIVLALRLALGFYVHGLLSLEDVAKLKWLDEINVIINKPVVAARPAVVPSVDLAAAALLDEDLDYRIAQRIGSLDGWRSFLTAHGSGVHAQSAREEVEKLLLAGQDSRAGRRGGLKWRVHGRESCERGHGFGPAFPGGGDRGSYA